MRNWQRLVGSVIVLAAGCSLPGPRAGTAAATDIDLMADVLSAQRVVELDVAHTAGGNLARQSALLDQAAAVPAPDVVHELDAATSDVLRRGVANAVAQARKRGPSAHGPFMIDAAFGFAGPERPTVMLLCRLCLEGYLVSRVADGGTAVEFFATDTIDATLAAASERYRSAMANPALKGAPKCSGVKWEMGMRSMLAGLLALLLAGCVPPPPPPRPAARPAPAPSVAARPIAQPPLLAAPVPQVPATSGASLVALVIADTTDHGSHPGGTSIAAGAVANERQMTALMQRVAQATGLTYKQFVIDANAGGVDNFNCANIVRTIQTLPIARGDTVVVHYSGHGFNIGPNNQWLFQESIGMAGGQGHAPSRMPYLYCGGFGGNPNLEDIVAWVGRAQPRLTLVISDSCNTYLKGTEPGPQHVLATRGAREEDLRLVSLFAEAQGVVVMAGADAGTYGFYSDRGGNFTLQFLEVLSGIEPSQRVTWGEFGGMLRPMRVQAVIDGRVQSLVQSPIYDIRS